MKCDLHQLNNIQKKVWDESESVSETVSINIENMKLRFLKTFRLIRIRKSCLRGLYGTILTHLKSTQMNRFGRLRISASFRIKSGRNKES